MSEYSIRQSTLTNLANAVRTATGTTDSLTPSDMVELTENVVGIPDNLIHLTGNCGGIYDGTTGKAIRNQIIDKITTSNIASCYNLLDGFEGSSCPFSINMQTTWDEGSENNINGISNQAI